MSEFSVPVYTEKDIDFYYGCRRITVAQEELNWSYKNGRYIIGIRVNLYHTTGGNFVSSWCDPNPIKYTLPGGYYLERTIYGGSIQLSSGVCFDSLLPDIEAQYGTKAEKRLFRKGARANRKVWGEILADGALYESAHFIIKVAKIQILEEWGHPLREGKE
jgi:hypothetical protein